MPAHLANGHLGIQGSDSGLAPARSFLAGVRDLTPSDFHRTALLPTWNAITVAVDSDDLEAVFARGAVTGYAQRLDFATGRLTTTYGLTLGGSRLQIEVELWPARHQPELCCQRLRITALDAAELAVTVGITANPESQRRPWRDLCWGHEDWPKEYGLGFHEKRMIYAWAPGHCALTEVENHHAPDVLAVLTQALAHGPAVGLALALDAPGVAWHDRSDSAGARREGHLRLAAGGALVLTQYLGISRDGAAAGLTAMRPGPCCGAGA